MKIEVKRIKDKVHYQASNEQGVLINMDGSEAIGGEGNGARPMELLLAGLGGCAGIDISLMLDKMRQKADKVEMEINGEREANAEPSLFQDIDIKFKFWGELQAKHVLRAVELSMTKYCSVAMTLNKSAKISYQSYINDELIK